jgi:hypothetical protein
VNNKTCSWVLALVVVAAVSAGGADQVRRLAVELADGSRIIGVPEVTSVGFSGPFVRTKVPLDALSGITVMEDRETVKLAFSNGDRLTGVLDTGAIALTTMVGRVSIPLAQVRAIRVMAGVGGGGLVLHYAFDEDTDESVKDASGMGNHGTRNGDVSYEQGHKGKAARFKAPDTYILSDAAALNVKDWQAFTVSLWAMPKKHTTYGHVITRGPVTGSTPGGFSIAIGAQYGQGFLAVCTKPEDSNASVVYPSSPNAPSGWGSTHALNTWVHLAGTYDGKTCRYYINGVLKTEVPATGPAMWDNPDSKLVVGTFGRTPYIHWGDMYFDGLIDDLRIYNRTLAPAEVVALAEQ